MILLFFVGTFFFVFFIFSQEKKKILYNSIAYGALSVYKRECVDGKTSEYMLCMV